MHIVKKMHNIAHTIEMSGIIFCIILIIFCIIICLYFQVRLERRQVDKSRFADNEFDKEYLLGGKFSAGKNER